MKVLVATKEGQGHRSSDIFDAEEGELVFYPLEGDCHVDAECGCRRSLLGSGMTTTIRVEEKPLSREDYIVACRESIIRSGRCKAEELEDSHWKESFSKIGADETTIDYFLSNFMLDPIEEADCLLACANKYPVGTVLERRCDEFYPRLIQKSEVEDINELITQGESKTLEFKESLSLDIRKQSKESYIELSALKTVAGFLNSNGGILLVGVSDDGNILGIDYEIAKFHSNNKDKFLLHFKNLINSKIGGNFYPYIEYKCVQVADLKVFRVECSKSETPCYLDEKDFYVRTNPATDKLEGRKMVEYITNHFSSSGKRQD